MNKCERVRLIDYGLRDYGVDGQYGREPSIAEYVDNMVVLMREVKRALKPTGTAFFNVADSYAGSRRGPVTNDVQASNAAASTSRLLAADEPPSKSLMLIPERLVLAFQQDGWIIRNQIVWHKPNPMPESVQDRFTRSYEVVFFMVKSPRYYFDAEAVATKVNSNGGNFSQKYSEAQPKHGAMILERPCPEYVNKRDVWSVTPASFKDAHFATFPEELITPMVLSGCPPCGVVLDPFMGSGTTGLVARKYNRRFIGSELNPEYVEMANSRLGKPYTVSMFS